MVDELVFALPPLGEGMVLDLLSGCGTATLEIARAYPKCKISVLDRCSYRLEQCERALASINSIIHTKHLVEVRKWGKNTSI